jgi:RNA polymerase sigma-70 factor, ECF subfamily
MGAEVVYASERFRDSERTGSPQPTGDRGRFEQLIARHHRRLRRAVAGIVADTAVVDDVLQEAYLKAYRRLPRRFSGEAHEIAWLSRVATRCALDEVRRRARRQRAAEAELLLLHARVAAEQTQQRLDAALDLEAIFRALHPTDRAILMLVGVLDLDQTTAARILRMSRGTLVWRLSAARIQLRELMGEEWS